MAGCYTFSHTSFDSSVVLASSEVLPTKAPAQIRQFQYAVLVHARPNGARIRPYGAIGPGLQLVRLSDALAGRSRHRALRVVYHEANLLSSAWDFGSTPPLEGGGIFQPTLQYGGGATLHLSPHTFVRFDLRETLSRQPDFWSKSYATIETVDENGVRTEAGELVLHSPLRHRLFTIGMGVSF